MMLDRTSNYTLAPPASIATITGQMLAKNRWSKQVRADNAAQYLAGRLEITKPTTHLAATLFAVSPTWVRRSFKRLPDQTVSPPSPELEIIPSAVIDLVSAFNRASPADRIRAARLIGVDNVWDAMLAPAI